MRIPAQVVAVEDQVAGDELAVAAASGQAVLQLWDAMHFNEVGGGTLELDDTNGNTTVLAYLSANLDANTVTMAANLAATWPLGTQVRVSPYEITRVAYVQPLDGVPEGELVSARVPYTMRDRVPVNERIDGLGEVIEMERVGYTFVVADVLGSLPVIGTDSLDMSGIAAALPPPSPTDGAPPASSPAPTVRGGVGFLVVEWDPVTNNDIVTYEVHISTTSGFGLTSATLYGEVAGTVMFIKTLPDGTPLVYGTTYYVKILAKDADGGAAASAQASGTPVKVVTGDIGAGTITSTEIADNSITTPKLVANAVTAAKIAADTITATEIAAGAITASELAANSVVAGKLEANLVLSSQIGTASSGQRVVLDGTGTYGPVGLYLLRTNAEGFDETVASITQSGASFGEVSIGTLTSDDVVTVNNGTIIRFVDPTNGSDDNDGLTPIATSDTFNRTTASGWGSASDGYHVWTIDMGAVGNFSTTTAPDARIVMGTTDEKVIRLNAGGALAEEVFWTCQADKAPNVGGLDCSVLFRAFTKRTLALEGEGLLAQFVWSSTAAPPQCRLWRLVDGTYTAFAVAVNAGAINWALNTNWSVRAQCYDVAGVTTIRMRAWRSSDAEPTTWTTTATISDQTFITDRGGQIAFRSATAALSNQPLTIQIKAFTYQLLDLDLLTSDDSDATAGTYNFSPTSTGPYQTVARATRDLPQYNNGLAAVCMSLGQPGGNGNGVTGVVNEAIAINGVMGSGKLIITGANPYVLGGLAINGCNQNVLISGITLSDPGDNPDNATLNINISRYVEVYQCMFEGNTGASYNVLFQQGSAGYVGSCQLHGAVVCVAAATGSYVFCNNNTGSGTNSYSATGSILQSNNTVPTGGFSAGSTALIITQGTGSGNTNISSTSSTPTTGGGTSPPTSSKRTKSWNQSGSGSYGLGFNTWSGGDVTQGQYGGSQNHKGMWVLPPAVAQTLASKTVDSAFLTVTRRSYGGGSGGSNVYLVSYTTDAMSGNPTVLSGPTLLGQLGWGQTKTFKIPPGIASDLANAGGTRRALGVYQSGGSPYVILSPNIHLKVTWH